MKAKEATELTSAFYKSRQFTLNQMITLIKETARQGQSSIRIDHRKLSKTVIEELRILGYNFLNSGYELGISW